MLYSNGMSPFQAFAKLQTGYSCGRRYFFDNRLQDRVQENAFDEAGVFAKSGQQCDLCFSLVSRSPLLARVETHDTDYIA